ncbi:DUF4435 domain-containing protein [Odoribacter sp. Z80]|uniref:DUF4435 domain-containing protein n=1 Tax=Odoribacter sp. Z80 TaxID=2304575 RepID=UPI00192A4835|nr:DUF4435 domain-containing protein [Odoribacter sp. Z80]
MFVCGDRENNGRGAHFANAAKRFALDAKMFRCRAAVHVENKDDIAFWSAVLKHFRPGDKFHFIAGSRNEYGNETYGVTQCLKYFPYLSPDFFICIDSDYRYLLRERHIDVKHFVIQTYTYSFENHHCFADGLDDVCCRVTRLKNTVFDFNRFLTEFSNILYELFIWHLYFQNADPIRFSQFEFDHYLNLTTSRSYPLVYDNGGRALDELRVRVERKLKFFGRKYPHANLEVVRQKYLQLGLTSDNVYLFVRGHNLYNLILLICKEVCKAVLRREKRNRVATREMLNELYRYRYSLEEQLKQNIKYGAYLPIRKIEEDIRQLLGEN